MPSTSIPRFFELTRDEILDVLLGMEIDLGTSSKLSLSLLQYRLNKALVATPTTHCKFPDGSGLDVYTLPQWDDTLNFKEEFTYCMTRRMSLPDYMTAKKAREPPHDDEDTDVDSFTMVLLHILAIVGMVHMDNISNFFVMAVDRGMIRGVYLKVLSKLKLSEKTPLLLVQHSVTHFKEESYSFLKFPTKIEQVKTTFLEQELILRILYSNTARLSQHLQPESSDGFFISLITPITLLRGYDIARLSKNTGCVVCGKNTKHLCSCRNAQYCSPGCQKKDWKEHKPICKPLSSGKWYNVFLHIELSGINEFGDDPRTEMYAYKAIVLLKLEWKTSHPEFGNVENIIITDQGQTMKMAILEMRNSEAWVAALGAFGKNDVIYRWGRHVKFGEWRICFDCAPLRDLSW